MEALKQGQTALSRYTNEFARVDHSLPGQGLPWLRELRTRALARFEARGFPGPRDEDWRYTNVTPIERHGFLPAVASPPGPLAGEHVQRLALPAAHLLVFVDGRFAPTLSRIDALPRGVIATSLAAALEAEPELVEPHLGRYADIGRHRFAALNTAFMTDGLFLWLPPRVLLADPVQLLFIATQPGTVSHPRNLIVANEASQAMVIEAYAGGEAASFTNVVTEALAGPGAQIEHCRLQQQGAKAFHIGLLAACQLGDSRFASHAVDIGALLARNDTDVRLDAPGGECALNGLYLLDGRQHIDNHTTIEHAKPHCTSRELYKGVLDGRSRAVFNGRVVVDPDAQQTDAQQTNRNLLLSRDAEVDTKPQLEIYADDVKCAHGATVGQLDANAVFYLRSRGIDEQAARSLLVYAFARDVIERTRHAPTRAWLEQLLAARMPAGQRFLESA